MVKRNKTRKNESRKFRSIKGGSRKSRSIKGGLRKKNKIEIAFDVCNNKYCTDLTKDLAQYNKEHAIKCPESLSNDEYDTCDHNLYTASNYKKLFYKNIECTKQYCAKERNDRARQYDNVPISKKDMTYWLNLLKKVKK